MRGEPSLKYLRYILSRAVGSIKMNSTPPPASSKKSPLSRRKRTFPTPVPCHGRGTSGGPSGMAASAAYPRPTRERARSVLAARRLYFCTALSLAREPNNSVASHVGPGLLASPPSGHVCAQILPIFVRLKYARGSAAYEHLRMVCTMPRLRQRPIGGNRHARRPLPPPPSRLQSLYS